MDRRTSEERHRTYLLGIGLDSEGEEYRVTRAEEFQILGGSERTHRRMQERFLRVQEELARDNRTISGLEPDEYDDLTRMLSED